MAESYLTIKASSEGFYKEKGSKFLAYAYPVSSREECKERVDSLKKEYHDARHHCYAFILGPEGKEVRAADDGEPNHSAGDPILGQIKSFGLTDVLVVVVRYFGGTKLGVSGLITAYRTAAEEALKVATVVSVEIKKEFELHYPYDKTQQVLRLVDEFNVEITDQMFHESCVLKGRIDPELIEGLENKLALIGLSLS